MFVQFAGMMAEFESHTKSERQHLHNKMWKAEGNRSVTEWGYTTKIYLRDGKERRVTRLNHRQVAAMRYLHWLLFTKLKSYGTAAELLTENLRRRVTEGREVDSRLLKRCPLGRFDVAKLIIKLPLIYPDRGYHSGRRKSGIAIKSLRYVR
jgi:hypothetical protein